MSYPPAEKEAIRLANLNINEIETEIRSEISTNLSWLINGLISAGRINGKGVEILNRIENESVSVIREHWVK